MLKITIIHFTHGINSSILSLKKGGLLMNLINKENTINLALRLMKLLASFIIITFGIVFMLKADLGMNPWSTFAMGVSNVTHISFGHANQLIGLAILLLMLSLKIYPGIATILDLTVIGFMVHIIEQLHVISTPNTLAMQLLMCISGLFMFCFGLIIYYKCGLGIGPRESIVMELVKKTNKGFATVKTTIESSVFLCGVLLGGDFGIGTIIITVFTGRIMEVLFKRYKYDVRAAEHLDIKNTFKYIKA